MLTTAGIRRLASTENVSGAFFWSITETVSDRELSAWEARCACAAPGSGLAIEATVEHERRRIGARVVPRPFFDPERKRS